MYYAYVLECADGSFYAGWTKDVPSRVDTHNTGKGAKYTRSRLPVRLLQFWVFDSQSEAMRFEKQFKALNRKAKERLLKPDASLL